jgi:hypothetical protein
MKKQRSPKTLISKLAQRATLDSLISSRKGRVGEYIKRLSLTDKAIIDTLRSDDIKNDGIRNYV